MGADAGNRLGSRKQYGVQYEDLAGFAQMKPAEFNQVFIATPQTKLIPRILPEREMKRVQIAAVHIGSQVIFFDRRGPYGRSRISTGYPAFSQVFQPPLR